MSRIVLSAILAGLLGASAAMAAPASAPAPRLATAIGIVDDSAAENGVIWFTLQRSDLRFQVKIDDVPDPDAIFAALRGSAESGRSLVVHYDVDSGAIEADGGKARFDFRDLVSDGKTIAGASVSGREPVPLAAESALARGMALGDTGDFEGARGLLGLVLTATDRSPRLRALALKTRAQDGEDEAILGFPPGSDRDRLLISALSDFRARGAIASDDPEAAYDVGRVLEDLGGYDEALSGFRAIASRWSNEAFWTSIRIGGVYRLMGDNARALAALDDLVARAGPQKGMAFHYHRGWTLTNLGRYDEAVAEFTAGLADQPDYAWAFSRRACALAMEGRLADALADQTRMITLMGQFRDGGAKTPGDLQNDRRAAEVAGELRSAISKTSNARLDAPCTGYWDAGDVRRERSALLAPIGR